MRVLYYGPFRDGSGYAMAARGYLKAFDKLIEEGEEIDLRLLTLDLEFVNSKLSDEDKKFVEKYEFPFSKYTGKTSVKEVEEWVNQPEPFVFIWHQPAPMITWERYKTGDRFWDSMRKCLKGAKKNINFTVWEADQVHPGWIDTFNIYNVDAVVVPSEYNEHTFERDLEGEAQKVYRIAHPVEVVKVTPEPINGMNFKDKFVVFSMSQWGIRKGFDKLILAYNMEFGHQQDTLLLLKTNGSIMNSEDPVKQKQAILNDVAHYKKMVHLDSFMEQPTCDMMVIADYLPYKNIQWLYEQASVFCLPARAEGFGLTIAEAIHNKVPVITTHVTGHAEFVDPYHPYNIEGTWEPYYSKSEFHADMNWFEPSLNSIRRCLRKAYKDWKSGSDKLEQIADSQLKYFNERDYSIGRVASDLKQMLEEVMQDAE
jgi:glycosyltransferase involved in cell wall biosynthesis